MQKKNLDLILAITLSVLNGLWTFLPYHIPMVGITLAIPLVFLLPGYILTQLLSHQRLIGASHGLILSIGLSLAIDILFGFILNILPGGLHATSWAMLLGLFTIGCSFWVTYLRSRTHMRQVSSWCVPLTLTNGILLGLALMIATLSVFYAAFGVMQQPRKMFTQFWLLPSKQANASCTVLIGIHSNEATSVTYHVVVTANNVQVAIWSPITLSPDEEGDRCVPIKLESAGITYIEARLYRVDKPNMIYREVHVTLNSSVKSAHSKSA